MTTWGGELLNGSPRFTLVAQGMGQKRKPSVLVSSPALSTSTGLPSTDLGSQGERRTRQRPLEGEGGLGLDLGWGTGAVWEPLTNPLSGHECF